MCYVIGALLLTQLKKSIQDELHALPDNSNYESGKELSNLVHSK